MLMVCGAAVSKTRPYPGFIKYQPPSLWKKMGQIRSKRDLRDNIASKVGEHSFESMRYSRNNLLEFYSHMLKNEESAIEITAVLGLELEELIYLSGSTKASKKLQKIYDRAQELLLEGKEESDGTEFFRAPTPSGDSKENPSGFSVETPKEKGGKTSEKLEVPDSGTSQGEQKTLNFGFDISPEISPKTTNTGNNTSLENNTSDTLAPDTLAPDSFTSDTLTPEQYRAGVDRIGLTPDSFTSGSSEHDNLEVKNSFSLPESFEKEAFSGFEPIENNISPEVSRPMESVNHVPAVKKVSDKSEKPEVKANEILKKTESKTQKTLFDF